MEDKEKIFSVATAEIERILNTKTIVGEPLTLNGATVIPLMSVGFGFALGTGAGQDSKSGGGRGSGVAGGGGIKPVAVLIADNDGVRLESIRGSTASAVEKIAENVGTALAKRAEPEQLT